MLAEGKTQREVAEYYGLKDKYVVKQLRIRERRKERKLEDVYKRQFPLRRSITPIMVSL